MATVRPVIGVYNADDASKTCGTVKVPAVFSAPLRPDVVRFVHTNVSKNKRQAYANMFESGYGTAAISWGTGRAMARIPRVPGSGTHRSGQAAFGNMCRGGGMFAPTKTWRRWHRRVNVTQKRHAVASALAASALPALVMARGHRVEDVAEFPLVVSNAAQSVTKTKDAIKLLNAVGLAADLAHVADNKKVRAGKGKMRGRRYVQRLGPLVVYASNDGIVKALNNLPGVDSCNVDQLNILDLAPGGTFGRMIVWTEEAFKRLRPLFGSYKAAAELKKGYHLPRPAMLNADVARIINSDEVQSVLNPAKAAPAKPAKKANPLVNKAARARVCPGAGKRHIDAKKSAKVTKATKKASTLFMRSVKASFAPSS